MTAIPCKPVAALLAAALLSVLLPVRAAEQLYDVEVIIFAQAKPALDSERWPEEPGQPDLEGAVELFADTPRPQASPFQLLGAEHHRLGTTLAKLEDSSNYRPLLHFAWRQPGLPREKALAVRIEREFPPIVPEQPAAEEGAAESAPVQAAEGVTPQRLIGTLRLVLSRYLHLEADLVYFLPAEESYPAEAPFSAADPAAEFERDMGWSQGFRLQESRRMRSRELHYLDHPLFGVVALVTPYEPPPEPAKPAPTAAPAAPAATPNTIKR